MTISRLQQLLNSLSQTDTVEAKKDLLIALGDEKDESVYPVLLKHLADPDPDIQYAAVVALGRHGNASAVAEIVKAKIFRSASAKVRRAAVNAAGHLGDVRVIEHLVRATEDEEWLVRDQAIGELKKKIQRMIEGGDSRSDKILLHMLSLKDPELVQMAVEGLVIQGEKGLEFLVRSLKSTLPVIRENTAKALGLSKNSNAVPPLMNLLQDRVSSVRKSAVEALGRLRDKHAIDSLVMALKDNVPEVQKQASAALVDFGLLSTEPLLQVLTHERNKFVIRSVILTLGEIRDPRSIPALTNLIRNPYFLIRSAAVDALVRFGSRIVPDLLPHLVPNQDSVDGLLRDAVNFDQPPVQLRAIRALGALEEHRATKVLKKVIQEGKPDVVQAARESMVQIGTGAWRRCCAILVLKEVGDSSILSHFIRALKDDSLNVRLEAVRALGKIGGKKAVGPLATIVRKSRFDYLRAEAMQELRNAGVGFPRALDAAIYALKDKDWNVRLHATGFLGNYLNDKSIRPLIPLLADPHWGVQQVAETALYNFGKRSADPLVEALGHRAPDMRLRAARLLGETGEERITVLLEKALKRKGERQDVREAMQEAVEKIRKTGKTEA